jgi:hypothetical protein
MVAVIKHPPCQAGEAFATVYAAFTIFVDVTKRFATAAVEADSPV